MGRPVSPPAGGRARPPGRRQAGHRFPRPRLGAVRCRGVAGVACARATGADPEARSGCRPPVTGRASVTAGDSPARRAAVRWLAIALVSLVGLVVVTLTLLSLSLI